MILLTMLLIPTFVALGFLIFGGHKITLKEFFVQLGAQVLIMGGFYAAISYGNTYDTEVWNGRVASKAREKVSCSHSYSCNCRTVCSGSGKSRSCHTVCQTCYEHAYDIDWAVYTTLKERLEINRIDRRGMGEPPRWTSVSIGEPTSTTHGYTNYVKGAPDSLFRHSGLVEKFKTRLPKYPINIYDYYRLDRFLTVETTVVDAAEWNKQLSDINADLGHAKQVNAVIVVTGQAPEDYYYALEQQWIGGKKNDVVVVVDVDETKKINWVEVMAWTDNRLFQVTLRDHIRSVGILDRDKILAYVKQDVSDLYVRKSMKDFEYLKSTITPSVGEWIAAMILGLLISVGIGIFFHKNDLDEMIGT